jgi:outer membrane protein assembly factor BamE (lipoprotein component of BamABCDE complex)
VCAALSCGLQPTVAATPATAPSQAANDAGTAEQFRVVPGQAIGSLRIGMREQDVTAALGMPKSTWTFLDGRRVYRWFQPPSNSGLGVGVDVTGAVDRIWVLNDVRYATSTGLHVGSTEGDIMKALGAPSESTFDAQLHMRKLVYAPMGLWLSIQLDQRYGFYNRVFEIGVIAPASSQARR